MKISKNLALSAKLITMVSETKYEKLKKIWKDAFIVTAILQDMALGLQEYVPKTHKRMEKLFLEQYADMARYPGGHLLMNAKSDGLLEIWLAIGRQVFSSLPDLSSNPSQPLSKISGGKTGCRKKPLAPASFLIHAIDVLGGNNSKNQKLFLEIIKEQARHDD